MLCAWIKYNDLLISEQNFVDLHIPKKRHISEKNYCFSCCNRKRNKSEENFTDFHITKE